MVILEAPMMTNDQTNDLNNKIRQEILVYSKDFKRSWVGLGRHLYAVWQDKLFRCWGFDAFDDYIEKEVGLKKVLAKKLLKSYLFLEEDEPQYLNNDFFEHRHADKIPGYDEINLLRLAKQKRELTKNDYAKLKKDVFDKGKMATDLRRDLTTLIKERKQVDPDEERELRNQAAIRKLMNSIRSFQKDMAALKLVPDNIVKEAKELLDQLEGQLD